MTSLICGSQKVKFTKTESRVVATRGLGVGDMGEMLVKKYKHPVIRQISSGDVMPNIIIMYYTILIAM